VSAAQILDGPLYLRTLGDELRELRRVRGLTRKQLQDRLAGGLSEQALATYELGTRSCTVVRLVELCLAMDEQPEHLVARVGSRLFVQAATPLFVNVARLARSASGELAPIRRWAQARLGAPEVPQVVGIDRTALDCLAHLCGLPVVRLERLLRRFSD
jgi:transcriptional regulator with XRE-family HTH domain